MITRISVGLTVLLKLTMALFVCPSLLEGQTNQPPDPPTGFAKIEQMIPMRDGVKLHTIIYAPKSHSEPLQFSSIVPPMESITFIVGFQPARYRS